MNEDDEQNSLPDKQPIDDLNAVVVIVIVIVVDHDRVSARVVWMWVVGRR
jgi:hypothetical protein